MTDRENYLRTIEFRNPEWIPCSIAICPADWHKHREKLEEIVLRHPLIFKDYKRGSVDFDNFPPRFREGEYFWDNWGCLWYSAQGGVEGRVVKNPLADWKALDTYKMPDPVKECDLSWVEDPSCTQFGGRDWEKAKRYVEEQRKKGLPTIVYGGCLFDRLYYLRGFENLMIDFATDAPQLPRLVEMLLNYEMRLISKWLEIGVDALWFHTDIGTQKGLMISPIKFRRYIKPMFKEIFTTCRKSGVHVELSSDGCLLEIIDDLIECGVSMHDPQIRANPLEKIESVYKGRICINLDLDRQMLPYCSPKDIKKQVKEVVKKLHSPEGGLMVWGVVCGGDIPLENIEAICEAMEEYCLKGK